ncbi:hypothetical protein [Pseudomonas sp. BNK-30]|uniref:hypothetical protein n=1 Tax=Pseudomonas sp. BNK-30 TaxID=3376165 RepID=UPI0039BF4FFD
MPWYRTGTVAITAGQTTVTGTGTAFALNARVGDAFQGPDGRWYEVTNIASATVLSILPAYQGATVSTGTYGLAPMQGYVKDSADALRALVNQYGNKLAALGTTGNYDILPVAKGGTGGANQTDARAGLGLGTSATLPATIAQAAGSISLPASSVVRVQEAVFAARALHGHYVNDSSVNIDNLPGGSAGLYSAATLGAKPPAGTFWWIETQQTYTGSSRVQTAVSYGSSGTSGAALKAREWIRISNVGGTAWGTWAEIFTTENIVGTVGQSGGTPTGSIIERGSNANGEYTRFADGTQICTTKVRTIRTLNSPSGSVFHGGSEPLRQFPIAFSSAPTIQITAGLEVGEAWFATAAGTTPNGLLLSATSWPAGYVFTQVSRAATYVCVEYTAIGRWF